MVSYHLNVEFALNDSHSSANPQRPTTTQARIHPSALHGHRMSHRMLGPCCLCPMMDASKPDFIEAAIYVTSDGEHAGEYMERREGGPDGQCCVIDASAGIRSC